MGKKATPIPREIFLGDWLDRCDIGKTEAAKIAGCTQPYISNIIASRKGNINALYLLALSEKMRITVNDLYRKPPPKSQLAEIREFSPQAQAALLGQTAPRPADHKRKPKAK